MGENIFFHFPIDFLIFREFSLIIQLCDPDSFATHLFLICIIKFHIDPCEYFAIEILFNGEKIVFPLILIFPKSVKESEGESE